MNLLTPSTAPLTIKLLILPESSLMTLASVLDVMRAANRIAQRRLFDWQLLTPNDQPAVLTCGLAIQADTAFTAQLQGDLLIVIAGFHPETHLDKQGLRLLRQLVTRFQLVGGIESGSWLLARIGLLDGRKATTHWEDLEDFALRFPAVSVKPDRYILDGKVFTTGGASPSFDFMLYLIRERYGQHLALEVASVFIYDPTHTGTDAQPLVSLGLLEIQEPRIARCIRLMEQTIDEPLSVAELASRMQLSLRMLEYLFQEHLKLSPGQYYRYLRLQTARRLIIDTRLPIREIALRCGFGSLAAFSRSFRVAYQLSPGQYRRAYRDH